MQAKRSSEFLSMFDFISFGSGSSGNAYLLSYQDDDEVFAPRSTILIDAGIGSRSLQSAMSQHGFSIHAVDGLLLTHDHSDHARNAGRLCEKFNIPVYATAKTFEGVKHNPTIKTISATDLCMAIVPRESFRVGQFVVTAFSVSHDSWDCVAYKVEVGGETFVLITDCGAMTAELGEQIRCAHYLVIESNHDVGMLECGPYPTHLKERILSSSGHLSNRACADALGQYLSERIRGVWLCHLSADNNKPALALAESAEVMSQFADAHLHVLPRKGTAIFRLHAPME